ncbi:uncharacterized protein [Littorina saxatilis]|uniref:Uncharacterized protein n=1 Tax=Littorina saxatilis TaxID=31220 RepID=A0AAN9FXN8_9CAEN
MVAMDSVALLTVVVCSTCMLVFTDGLPMGQGGCPFLPCPAPRPGCKQLAPTLYWLNQSDTGLQVLCQGCEMCTEPQADERPERELTKESQCEDILCAPLPSSCVVHATREPSQLVASNGQPCPVCPVCLDYVSGLTG